VAKVRLIAAEPRVVPWLGAQTTVQPDQVVTVPDAQFEAYVCQSEVWEPVEEPTEPDPEPAPAPRPARKTTTSRTED
jgi:hypothetical protein